MLLICSSNLWAEGHEAPKVEGDVASITNQGETKYYSTIGDAMADWQTNGGTLTLLDNCEYTTTNVFSLPKTEGTQIEAELDLNGQTLTFKSSYMLGWGIRIRSGAVLTIKDGIGQTDNGKLSLVMTRNNTNLYGMYIAGGVLNINGGSFDASVATAGKEADVCYLASTANSELNISAGIFENNVISKNTNFHITGGEFKNAANNEYDSFDKYTAPNTYLSLGSDDYYTLKEIPDEDVVATVDGVKYRKFDLACERSSKEYKAILQKDITPEGGIVISTDKKCYLDLNNHTITRHGWMFDVYGALDIDGTGTLYSTRDSGAPVIIYVYGTSDPDEPYNHVLNIGENVTLKCKVGYGISVYNVNNGNYAYGVEINVNGTIQTSSGIAILGSIQRTSGNVPIININDGAKIYGRVGGDGDPDQDGRSIYAAGYGIWNVGKATLTANNPIHVKAGTINLNGTEITATRDFYTPITYYGNGGKPTGDAITIESNPVYAGNILININNGTTVVSKAGYAIEEGVVCKDSNGTDCTDKTKQIGLTVNDGEGADLVNKFSGAKGTMKFSESFAQALKDGSIEGKEAGQYDWVQNAIIGGKYSAMPEVVADGYMVKMTSDAQFPYEVVAKTEETGITDITAITQDTTEPADYTVKKGTGLIVRTGNTLKITGKLFIGEDVNWPAQVTVEPGATLIVGNGIEINASNEAIYKNALVLQADKENGTASLLFGTGATGDVNPVASVEMYMYGHLLSEGADETNPQNFKWQHFGLPIYSDGDIEKTMPVWYFDWNVKNGWVRVSGADIKGEGPWAIHNTTTNLVNEGSKFVFKGNLIGNQNVTTTLDRAGYFGFANSYTAPLSMENVITKLQEKGLQAGIWLYDASGDIAEFTAYSLGDIEDDGDKGVLPMQAFFMFNQAGGSKSIEINYASDVYNFKPADGSAGAAYRAAEADVNGGKITLSDGVEAATLTIREAERFSDEYDNGYDMYQMESTGMIQIYTIQGDSKLASIATNSINGKEIAIVTKANTEYTLSFSKLKGNAFKLTDIASGADIEVGEDKTYTFTAAANSTIVRFRLGEGEVSADEADADAVKVWVANNALNIAGAAEGDAIELINLAGVKVLSATATGEAVQSISLSGIASGAYIVKVGAATVKVIK